MAAAQAAVNAFQTVTQTVSTSEVVVYTAPVGYTGVVLLAQCTNTGTSTHTVTLQFRRDGTDVPVTNRFVVLVIPVTVTPAPAVSNFLLLL
jgi:acyl-coenzyme A thioesterase PaaI-like protein